MNGNGKLNGAYNHEESIEIQEKYNKDKIDSNGLNNDNNSEKK
jgi:hypothetical protein